MAAYNGSLILFGGLHDIVYEINDFFLFKGGVWKEIESSSSRQHTGNDKLFLEKSASNNIGNTLEEENHSELRKINAFQQNKTFARKHHKPSAIPAKSTNISNSILIRDNVNPNQLKQERKKREMQEKKKKLLKEFAINEEEINSMKREKSPTTEALRNSLLMIKQPNKKASVLVKGVSPITSKAGLEKAEKPGNTRPLARDGHSLVLNNDVMFIFGGDRHKMTFGDLFSLDLKNIVN